MSLNISWMRYLSVWLLVSAAFSAVIFNLKSTFLHQAFSQFGPVERAVVVTDDRGRPTGRGLVEFANKAAARKALERCTEGALLLTT